MASDREWIAREIKRVLRPGRSIRPRDSKEFVCEVDDLAGRILKIARERSAEQALPLLETLIAACYEKVGEVEDPDGFFWQLLQQFLCDWVLLRQEAGRDAAQTVALLIRWMVQDQYGVGFELDQELINVLDADGLQAFRNQVRARLRTLPGDDRGPGGDQRWRWKVILGRIQAAQTDDHP